MELLCLLSACVFSVLGLSAAAEAEKLVKKEDEDVVLPCSVPFSVTNELFDWKKVSHSDIFHYQKGTYNNFRGPVFHFEDELESGNASVVIRKAQVTDSGNYTCNFPNHPPMEKAHIDLTVDPILKPRNISGAARWPLTTQHKASNGILLKCRVLGAFPKPEVRWLDSSGNVLLPDEDPQVSYRDHHYDVVLKTTVTESGHYSCEATQREIHQRNQTETYVSVPEKPSAVIVGVIVGVIGIVVGIVIGVVAGVCFAKRHRGRHGTANGLI